MNDHLDDTGQFKMKLDGDVEVESGAIKTQVDDLRIEKLNHRMTLISILIPVLIVVILVIAYLDIKKRVIQTEDTGQLTAESLSKDLESRFETLAVAQRVIEENLARLKDQTNQSVAKVQVGLKKLDDRLKSSSKAMASRKDMQATAAKLDQNMVNVAQSLEELRLNVDRLAKTLPAGMTELESAMTAVREQMATQEQSLNTLDQQKMDKSAMDLAIKLEVLKIKQTYKAQLDDIQTRLKSLEGSVARLASKPTPSRQQAPATNPSPAPASPAPVPGKLEEQTIN